MKKAFKVLALLLAVALTAFSLSSCQELDEKKANRAVYSDDKREITYQDNVYRLLIAGKYEFITGSDYGWNTLYVTTKDVPVLLAESFGNPMSVLNNHTVLRVNALPSALSEELGNQVKEYDTSYQYSNFYYVRSDKYDEVQETIDNAKLEDYYFEYWSYGADYDDYSTDMLNESRPVEGRYVQVKLDDDMKDVVDRAMNATTNDKVSYTELSTGDYDLKSIELSTCDKNMVITQNGIGYYLIKDGDKYYFWDGNYFEEYSMVPLSESDAALAAALFKKYEDAISYSDILWQFEDLNNYNKDIERPIDDLQY